jgi:hypothetical protein
MVIAMASKQNGQHGVSTGSGSDRVTLAISEPLAQRPGRYRSRY